MTREGGRGGKKGEVGGLVVKYECISRFFLRPMQVRVVSSNAQLNCAAELQTVSNGPAVQLQALWVTRNERCKPHYYSWFSRP